MVNRGMAVVMEKDEGIADSEEKSRSRKKCDWLFLIVYSIVVSVLVNAANRIEALKGIFIEG